MISNLQITSHKLQLNLGANSVATTHYNDEILYQF